MAEMIFGIVLIVVGIFFASDGIKEQCNLKNYILKTEVTAVFKDVDWSRNSFRANDVLLKDNKGHDTFYSSEEIDKAIKKLNEKL